MIDEFIKRLNQIHGAFINMNLAYMLLESKMQELMPDNSKTIHFSDEDPDDPKTKLTLSVNIGEFKDRIKKNGHDTKLVSNLCLVAIYQLWVDEYRAKISEEMGLKKNDLLIDIFGDLRIIRQAVIHNNSNRFNDFKKIKKLEFMKQRDIVFASNSEFGTIVSLVKEELRKFM